MVRTRDGFITGTNYGRQLGDMDRRAERLHLLYTPTDKLQIDISGFMLQDYSDPGIGVPLSVGPGVVDPFAALGFFRKDGCGPSHPSSGAGGCETGGGGLSAATGAGKSASTRGCLSS